MAASVLYFGPDECNRVQVLKSAGYRVRECHELEDLKSALRMPPAPAAVLMRDPGVASFKPAIEIVHTSALAPVIVFPSPDGSELEEPVDLVVPPLTRPAEWLQELADLIEKSRGSREDAISLHEKSTTLIQQAVAIRYKSAADRAMRENSSAPREKARNLHSRAEREPNSED